MRFKRALSSYSNEVRTGLQKYLAGPIPPYDAGKRGTSVALWSYLRCGGIWRGRHVIYGRPGGYH